MPKASFANASYALAPALPEDFKTKILRLCTMTKGVEVMNRKAQYLPQLLCLALEVDLSPSELQIIFEHIFHSLTLQGYLPVGHLPPVEHMCRARTPVNGMYKPLLNQSTGRVIFHGAFI